MDRATERFSRREGQIMEILYSRRKASAAEIHQALPDPPSYSATRALLAILVSKGHVTYKARGNRYIYQPRVPRTKAGPSALIRVLNSFYDGSLSAAVAGLIESRQAALTREEIERLNVILEAAGAETPAPAESSKTKSSDRKS